MPISNYSAAYNSKITAQFLAANTTYFIVVDGYSASSNGDYQLNVNESVGLNAPDSTNIPLIMINTNNKLIVDEPKINVDFKSLIILPTTSTILLTRGIFTVELQESK